MVSRKTGSAGAFQVASAPSPFGDLGEDDDPVPFLASDVHGAAHVDGLEKLPAPDMEGLGRRKKEGGEKRIAALGR